MPMGLTLPREACGWDRHRTRNEQCYNTPRCVDKNKVEGRDLPLACTVRRGRTGTAGENRSPRVWRQDWVNALATELGGLSAAGRSLARQSGKRLP